MQAEIPDLHEFPPFERSRIASFHRRQSGSVFGSFAFGCFAFGCFAIAIWLSGDSGGFAGLDFFAFRGLNPLAFQPPHFLLPLFKCLHVVSPLCKPDKLVKRRGRSGRDGYYQRGSRRWRPEPPPFPRRPPPPLPFGRASLTFRARPSKSVPFRPAMARSASSVLVISTNAKPRGRPVSQIGRASCR